MIDALNKNLFLKLPRLVNLNSRNSWNSWNLKLIFEDFEKMHVRVC